MDSASPLQITLLTATWNRANLLQRLYQSIVQNLPDACRLEWLVIDDGSDDNTEQLVRRFSSENLLPVRYERVSHGGKHRALNTGFSLAAGSWIFIIDSDDWFLENGIALATREIEKAEADGADGLFIPMAVAGRDEQFLFENPRRCANVVDRINQERLFDSSFVFGSRITRQRFDEIEGEDFLAESSFLLKLDASVRFYLSDAVCVGVEYQPDGLSLDNLRVRMSSPVGQTLTYNRMLDKNLIRRIKLRALANYGRFWWHCRLQVLKPYGPMSFTKFLAILVALPLTITDFFRLRARRR